MDTRNKILTLDAALCLPQPLTVVTGYFDVLRADHVRDLRQARATAPERPLLAVVLPGEDALLDQRARAEMLAALRMVDYVVPAAGSGLELLQAALPSSQWVRLEAADQRRSRQLMEHVRNRQAP